MWFDPNVIVTSHTGTAKLSFNLIFQPYISVSVWGSQIPLLLASPQISYSAAKKLM